MINYYSLDKIEKEDNLAFGYFQGEKFEVFYPEQDELYNEQDLIERGLAKCDAPNWNETMLMEENSIIN